MLPRHRKLRQLEFRLPMTDQRTGTHHLFPHQRHQDLPTRIDNAPGILQLTLILLLDPEQLFDPGEVQLAKTPDMTVFEVDDTEGFGHGSSRSSFRRPRGSSPLVLMPTKWKTAARCRDKASHHTTLLAATEAPCSHPDMRGREPTLLASPSPRVGRRLQNPPGRGDSGAS